MTKSEAVRKLVTWCNDQVGTREGANNYNKYAADPRITQLLGWNSQNQPWCDIFTDAAFIECFGLAAGAAMTYQPIGAGSALCSASAQFFKNNGAWITGRPDPGDVVFFLVSGGINHQGIVTQVSGNVVTTVEGNSSDMVARRIYTIGSSQIAGYGRPKWELVADESAADTDGQEPLPAAQAREGSEGSHQKHATCTPTLPVLRRGDQGVPVERMQALLISRGYYCGGRILRGQEHPDGEFGPATEVAVCDLQIAAKISKDGVVGAETWAALVTL